MNPRRYSTPTLIGIGIGIVIVPILFLPLAVLMTWTVLTERRR